MGFVQTLPERTILDEIQRAPELFTSIKANVDQNRQPGRFILTGSAMIQRDIQDIANIRNLDSLPILLSLAASQTARLFNATDLASPFAISRPTIREYLVLLEQIFLIEQLQPWHSNRLSRLIKTPKLHLTDTGLACSLLGINSRNLWQD